MAHRNTIFRQLLQLDDRHFFNLVERERFGSGREYRSLTRWQQFTAMIFAQLAGLTSSGLKGNGMSDDVDVFVGDWRDRQGNRLSIRKLAKNRAAVTFLAGSKPEPVRRPYFGDRPSVDMPAKVDRWGISLIVELWKKGEGYQLVLTHEHNYELDEQHRESLIPALSQYAGDTRFDNYRSLFGNLKHYVRAECGAGSTR
jgi:hypothetical protein